jgi:hypothetical protein
VLDNGNMERRHPETEKTKRVERMRTGEGLVEHDGSVFRVTIADAASWNNDTLKNELRVLARNFANIPKLYKKARKQGCSSPYTHSVFCDRHHRLHKLRERVSKNSRVCG